MPAYLLLAIAIAAEVAATSALKAADGFSRPGPSVVVVVGYAIAFYLLSIVVKSMPVGVAYAVWSGAGVVLVALVGVFFYRQVPDLAAAAGMALIVAGVVILNLFSNMDVH